MGFNGKLPLSIDNKAEIEHRLKKYTSYKDDCWLFIRTVSKITGYGGLNVGGTKYNVHRLSAYIFLNLDLNDRNQQANHKCSHKNCWNPDHLYIGNQSENLKDSWKERKE